jgi:hypothetical protein
MVADCDDGIPNLTVCAGSRADDPSAAKAITMNLRECIVMMGVGLMISNRVG